MSIEILNVDCMEYMATCEDNAFDPFLGTGTTAISSYYNSIDFVGCEIDKDYYNSAKSRIERETKQIDIFQESA